MNGLSFFLSSSSRSDDRKLSSAENDVELVSVEDIADADLFRFEGTIRIVIF